MFNRIFSVIFIGILALQTSGFTMANTTDLKIEITQEGSGAVAENSIMIGDDYGPDVLGAKGVGMDQVYFTPEIQSEEGATFVVDNLLELKNIL